MTLSPETLIEDDRWQTLGLAALAQQACGALAQVITLPNEAFEFALLAGDDARIQSLNAAHRNIDKPTNVLSWPSEDLSAENDGGTPSPPGIPELGDIALAYETCAREAAEQGKPLAAHVTHLIVHGVLHLLGYDHDTDANAARMEGLEIKTLELMGLPSPY